MLLLTSWLFPSEQQQQVFIDFQLLFNYSPKLEKLNSVEDDESLLSPIKTSTSNGRKKNRILASSDEEDIENENASANSRPTVVKTISRKFQEYVLLRLL